MQRRKNYKIQCGNGKYKQKYCRIQKYKFEKENVKENHRKDIKEEG